MMYPHLFIFYLLIFRNVFKINLSAFYLYLYSSKNQPKKGWVGLRKTKKKREREI